MPNQSRVVTPVCAILQNPPPVRRRILVCVFLGVQNGVIEVLFGGEVPKKDGLADPGLRGDIAGLGAREAAAGKYVDGRAQEPGSGDRWTTCESFSTVRAA